MWAYIKEHGLQDPKDKRVIIFGGCWSAIIFGGCWPAGQVSAHLRGQRLVVALRQHCTNTWHLTCTSSRRLGATRRLFFPAFALLLCRREAAEAVPGHPLQHVQAAEAAVQALQDQRCVLALVPV